MRTSKRISQIVLALLALFTLSISAMAADPGLTYPPTSEISDQKAGSILFYNIYTSSAASSNTQNTRINITNTSTTSAAFVHLFFVADTCSVADSFICLTANQTASFLASDIDPGVSGYIVAVASDGVNGCPFSFNFLIGDEYVKFASGHSAKLGAEAIAALYNGVLPGCDANSTTAVINFDGVVGIGYNRVPSVLAASSIGSNLDGNSTMLIVNRVGGNLGIGASTLGTLFGLLYDDAEAAVSFQLSGSCQLRNVLGNSFPRVAGTFNGLIGQGRTGWMKIFNQTAAIGILGATLTFNDTAGTQSGAFTGGSNMHKLRLTTASYTMPIFAPGC